MNTDKLATEIYIKKFTIENPGVSTANLAIDPATIMMIIQMVQQVIGCLQSRSASNISIQNNLSKPSFFDRLGLRRRIFFAMGFRRYRQEGRAMYDSITDVGKTLTLSDITLLLQGDAE